MKHERLRQALESGANVGDAEFDEIYSVEHRLVSNTFWTPVETARRAAAFLVGEGARRILDVGAGVGKFCLVGALSTPRARFVGVEQRSHLVAAANDATKLLGSPRAEFIHARFGDIATDGFDGFYFYNPFAENLFQIENRLDDTVDLSETRHTSDLELARRTLTSAPSGTTVVTYWIDGRNRQRARHIPPVYDLIHTERSRGGALSLWRK